MAHGGAGGPWEHYDACERACEAALAELRGGASAMDAAVEATVLLEDDPRLNAGVGSSYRLDGKTIEMDAAVMDDRLRFGGVAAIQNVQYPIRVARLVLDSPHLLLAGEGATAFARSHGIPYFYPDSERARRRYAQVRRFFLAHEDRDGFAAWRGRRPEEYWNFPSDIQASLLREAALESTSDTVGAVVRDARGGFGVALSTGGTSIMLLGRVGDTPIIGAGLYAGPHGAVAATGDGEEIMRQLLAKRVYDWIAAGMDAQEACRRGVDDFPDPYTAGIIAVAASSVGAADNRTMPWAVGRLD
ncbi:MAG: isoaspartyl peptidase/L-asparaginase [Candidatus Eisenbacteria bacterium]